jgi:predicted NAD/FAD-dependent oxidoreductase
MKLHAENVSVLVAGAGAAGLGAALAAARAGATVAQVDAGPFLGGTVSRTLIHTLGGLFDAAGELVDPGLPAELVQRLQRADSGVYRRQMGKVWMLSVCPSVYRRVIKAWVREEPRLRVRPGMCIREVRRQSDGTLLVKASSVGGAPHV